MAELNGIQQRELIELVKQHHPHLGETEIRKLLNRAQNIICEETEVLENIFTDTTVADQRFYDFDDLLLRVKRVELEDEDGNYYAIPELANPPILGDDV